jgi:hypothetical protein
MYYRNQHGLYTNRWSGDVLWTTSEGVWNEVCSANLHNDTLTLLQQSKPKRWALFVDCTHWEGVIEEAGNLWFSQYFKMCVGQGAECFAATMPSQLHASLVKKFTIQCAELVPTQILLNTRDALLWLEERGFRVDPASSPNP